MHLRRSIVGTAALVALLAPAGCGDAPQPEPEKPLASEVEAPILSPEEAAWEKAGTDAGRLAWVQGRLPAVKGDEAEAKKLHAFLMSRERTDLAGMVTDARLEASPDDEWANGRKGRTNMRSELEAAAAKRDLLDATPCDAWVRLRDRLDEGRTWADPGADKASIEADLETVADHVRRLEDPWQREMLAVVKEVTENPRFQPYHPLVYVDLEPYVVIAQEQTETNKQSTKVVLERHSKLFKCLVTNFREMMNECGLPSPSVGELGNPVLKSFVFTDRGEFEDYHERYGGSNWLKGVRAYYSWGGDQFMMLYDTGVSGLAQDPDTSVAFHEATHQLVHYYRQWYLWQERKKENPAATKPGLTDMALHGRSHFFGEGIAEVFGGCRLISLGSGEWKLRVRLMNRISEWGSPSNRKDPDWSLREVLQMTGKAQLDLMGERKWPGHQQELSSLFYAQAWALHDFLYNGDKGAWRDLYLDYIAEEMKCNSGYEVFLKCFEIEDVNDKEEVDSFINDLESRWREYQDEIYMEQLDR